MPKIKFNEANRPYYSDDFIKGFECGTERQYKADQKTGHWIESKDERGCIKLTCSCCGYGSAINSGGNFCRDCGARMVEPQESEDK